MLHRIMFLTCNKYIMSKIENCMTADTALIDFILLQKHPVYCKLD